MTERFHTSSGPSAAQLPRGLVREIVRRWGYNATSYQILNPGFSFWIDTAADAAVGYVACHGVRVVGGAPVCPDDQLANVLAAFERDAAAAGQGVIYFGAERRIAEVAMADSRRTTFPIGAQPVWSPAVLLREFSAHASLRAQLNRAQNKGVSTRLLSQVDAATARALNSCLNEWIASRGLPALHFLIETQTLEALMDRRVIVAERAGALVGFVVLTPIPARNGWLVEQMVRGRRAPNGTVELLLQQAANLAAAAHADMITLGLAPLARRGSPAVNRLPHWTRALLAVLRAHGRRFYNFEGLEAFKAKFGGSQWESVYASLAPETSLARALMAVTVAFSGERIRAFIPHVVRHALAHP
ncbi:MAG TPA: phosphatidylglycerol lysyltransferase domain-containing protein [Longimicrobiales bacterium]